MLSSQNHHGNKATAAARLSECRKNTENSDCQGRVEAVTWGVGPAIFRFMLDRQQELKGLKAHASSAYWPEIQVLTIHFCRIINPVNKTRTAKVFMLSVTHSWFWYAHHHHLYHTQRWVNVSSLLDHQKMYPAADSLTYMSTTLRSIHPRSGWPLHKRSAMILVEVSQ